MPAQVVPSIPDDVDVVIVGAGLAGLYQLHRLRELGLSVHALETGGDVGGTWYWNRYPGARCDIESMAYSYSFSSDLEQEWTWSEKYATQPEILRYAAHVATRFGLRKDITFNTTVTAAHYDETTQHWTVTTDCGASITSRFIVMATGCLSSSNVPRLPGLESFRGRTYHTGRWPTAGVDFAGLRVGVIGTGSSGIQCIPIIAGQAAELSVFQRTANFTNPARNRPLDPAEVAERKATYPEFRRMLRQSKNGVPKPVPTKGALEASADERAAVYEAAWNSGILGAFSSAFDDILVDIDANDTAADFVRDKIRSIVRDPVTAEALCPKDYPIGAKRPCLDSNYYETFNRSNVRLVNLRTTTIEEVTESGLRTSTEQFELDAIVFATGFDAVTGALAAIDIRGKGDQTLRDKWADGPRNYLGLLTAGFPNLFTITGPFSPSVLANMLIAIEQHVEWITGCIAHMRTNDLTEVDTTDSFEDSWTAHVAEIAQGTLYPRAASWYMGANVPGKPRVFLPYVGGLGTYGDHLDSVAASGYPGFTFSAAVGAVS